MGNKVTRSHKLEWGFSFRRLEVENNELEGPPVLLSFNLNKSNNPTIKFMWAKVQ